ncbi:MAG TPA: glycogen synthase [Thermoanaerobaculia bacterium]|nr:glycogen synthase [Thermoanaerobaculia bacterium]
MPPLRVLQVAAEATPFAKTGGLGDVVSGLSRFLGRAGHDARVFLPLYAHLARERDRYTPVDFIQGVPVRLGPWRFTYSVLTTPLPQSDVHAYFIDCPELFGHGEIYQGDREDSLRFALLTVAAFECAQRMGWTPDILHCHDWHTALAPVYRRAFLDWDRLFRRTKTVLTIHNLGFQGIVDLSRLSDLGLDGHAKLVDLSPGNLNFLRNGILHADALTTVSRTYAREIQTPAQGFGLDPLLRARGDRLVGIVNGVDYDEWSPETDPRIPHHYSARDLSGKSAMKGALLQGIGMEETAAPVLGVVSRLTAQKGFDLSFEVLPELLARRDLRVVALGSGESRFEEFFRRLHEQFPGRAWFYRGFNNELAHWIEAGADLFLMPSRFEPCGLNQMYSLRYGTPPVVHKTGGLADTVEPFDASTGQGTGFVFEHFDAQGFRWALGQALDVFLQRETWERLMRNGMAKDFSWDRQGEEYVELYRRLAG